MSKPIVAIIGRQNVGKSTLMNRLAGKRISIVEDFPGTTRDRVFVDVSWNDRSFTLVDTGGLELGMVTEIDRGVKEQISQAMSEADAIVFMVDVKDGIMPADTEIADLVRRLKKPALLVANKGDNDKLEAQAVEDLVDARRRQRAEQSRAVGFAVGPALVLGLPVFSARQPPVDRFRVGVGGHAGRNGAGALHPESTRAGL